MWKQLELPWRIAFEEAWKAYKRGSVPVGAALMDESKTLVVSGRNSETDLSDSHLRQHPLAHATLNTLLKIQAPKHPNIANYHLYMTLEPCTLCMGAILMTGIQHLTFAAKDSILGSTGIKSSCLGLSDLEITGPIPTLQSLQIALKTVYALESGEANQDDGLKIWEKDCVCGVKAGREWHEKGLLREFRQQDLPFDQVYEKLLTYLCEC